MPSHFTLSDALVERLAKAAEEAGLSQDKFVALAVAEKIARYDHAMWLSRNETQRDIQQADEAEASTPFAGKVQRAP